VEALKMLEATNYKILITDLVMPEMSGPEFIKEAKSINAFLQVIAMTGFVTNENIMLAFKYGANNCFFKPFKSLDVLKTEIDIASAKIDRISEVLRERIALK
jgi:DNA-binding NtrC family response regulator